MTMRTLKYLSLSVVFISTLFMAACGPIYQTTNTYVPPKSRHGRLCANRCITQKSVCQNNCSILNQSCHMQANAIAMPAYNAYLKKIDKEKKVPNKNIRYFADYSSCQNGCHCNTNYDLCFTNCGGQIIPRTVCTLFCDTAKPGTL